MKIPKIIVMTSSCLIAGFFVFLGVYVLHRFRCVANFGPEFNIKWKALHIPVIPSGWKIYSRDNTATAWEAPKVSRGHGFKVVVYDGCDLDREKDYYYFSSKNSQDTVLEVHYRFVNKHRSKDSTVSIFQVGNHADTITTKQADSIFFANKINRDF